MTNELLPSVPGYGITRIAITGFGPFPGVPFNASAALVAHMAEEARRLPGVEVAIAILPVEWAAAREHSRRLIEAAKPQAVLHFGVSAAATGFEIETRAVNCANGHVDQSGACAAAEYLRQEGPPVLRTNYPAATLARTLNGEGVPATVSDNAGHYLCNAVFYETLHDCAGRTNPPLAAFIHMPALSEQAISAEPQWQTLLRGAAVILDFTVQLALGLSVPAGCTS